METTTVSPNQAQAPAATETNAASLDAQIFSKMTAMRETTERNLIRKAADGTATGEEDAAADSTSVAPEGAEVADAGDDEYYSDDQSVEAQDSQEPVSDNTTDSTAEDLIDFIEFANDHPNAKFKFMKNGKEVVIDAKKAAAILGQGSAIHEEARQLKIERAEWDEYVKGARQQQDTLTLAMEFTVQPKLEKAYKEILKTQGYQTTFQQQLARTQDPAERARIQASMQQNEQWIRQQQKTINRLKPAVDQFRNIRTQQVAQALDYSRKNFKDKELKNEYVFNELRTKIEKAWPYAKFESMPGIANIDLVTSDETLLGLVRDGLRYRDKPTAKSAGASIASLTQRKGSSNSNRGANDNIEKLREQANRGDKKAADNLLVARLQSIRGGRGAR